MPKASHCPRLHVRSRNDSPEARATQQLYVAPRAASQCCCPRCRHVSNRDKTTNIGQTSVFAQNKGQSRLLLMIYPLFNVALCVKVAMVGRILSKVAMAAGTIRFSRLLLPSHLGRAGKQQAAAAAGGPTAAPLATAGGNNCSKVKLKDADSEKKKKRERERAAFQDRCRVSGDAAPRP